MRVCEINHHYGRLEGRSLEVTLTELRWTGQEAGKNRTILTKGSNALLPARRPNKTEFKRATHFLSLANYVCSENNYYIEFHWKYQWTISDSHYLYVMEMWSISNSHIIPYTLNSFRKTELSVRIWIIVVLWRGGFSPFVAQRPAWRNHCSRGIQLSDINKDSLWETRESH